MIRKLLATTAVAALLATGAYAQTTPAPMETAPAGQAAAPAKKVADGHLASNLIGETVYNGTGEEAENIGEVNDLVLSADGQIQAVVIGVGGFLGLGEKNVAIEYGLVSWSQRDNDEILVVETTADALKAQEDFDRLAYEPVSGDVNVTETKPATAEDLAKAPVNADNTAAPASDTTAMAPAAPATDTSASSNQAAPTGTMAGTEQQAGDAAPAQPDATAAAPAAPAGDTTAQAPAAAPADTGTTAAIDRSTLTPLDTAQIKTEEFVGTTVYGANDEMVGEIGDVVMQGDKVDAVIIDVGGFLGVGEKQVAVGLDNLAFMTDADGDRYLYTEWTKEALEAQPEYDEGTYVQNRDTMRMVVPN